MNDFLKGILAIITCAGLLAIASTHLVNSSSDNITYTKDELKELILLTYTTAWTHGANSCVESVNSDQDWNREIAHKALRSDSTYFHSVVIPLIYE